MDHISVYMSSKIEEAVDLLIENAALVCLAKGLIKQSDLLHDKCLESGIKIILELEICPNL